jgi:signal transduction histidine kinase
VTERPPTPSWQARIGGRWAISIQSFVVGVVLNTAILALTGGQIGADEVQTEDIGSWALLGIVASLIVGVYALAANASVFRNRRVTPVPAWVAIAFHLGVGIIFGLVVVLAGDRLIDPSDQSAVERVVVIALIGLWWGITAALVLEARDRFNREREQLIEQAVALELTTISEAEAAMRLRSTIAREAGPALDHTRGEVDAVLAGFATQTHALLPVEDWWRISQSLRATADATIRPLSHELWDATSRQYPKPRLGRVLSRLVLYQRFAVLPSMTILAIGYLPAGTYRFGLVGGLLATIVMTAGAGALLVAGNALMRRLPRGHGALFLGTFLAVEAYAAAYLALLAAVAGESFTMGAEVVGGLIAVGNSVLLPAAYACLNSVRDDVLDRFRLDTDHAMVRQLANARQLARLTRVAARDLHGTVQTRLISCAVAIEQASRSGDVDQFRHALEASIAILDAPLPDHADDPSATLAEEIDRMCAPWAGLCAFTLDLDPAAAAMRGPVAMAAGRIVEEAVGNACRHGLAESVSIRVTRIDGPALAFEIDDDGQGPTGGAPGLGTAMLAGLSRGRVALERRATGGARLLVTLPID